MSNLIIGGDVVPTKSNELLLTKDPKSVWRGVYDLFHQSDCVFVNLECPCTNATSTIRKSGPYLKSVPDALNGLKAANVGIVSLANNHVMDYGVKGFQETCEKLKSLNISYVGAGETPEDARKTHFTQVNNIAIGIISVAQHEFSIVSADRAGANPFEPFATSQDIIRAKENADIVIVVFHGGTEEYQWPSPNLQYICRALVDIGADYVICQQSHCIGSYEAYKSGHIVYGQGNLISDYGDKELWQTGILLNILLETKGIEFIPIVKKGFAVDLGNANEIEKILSGFEQRSRETLDSDFVSKKWLEHCRNASSYYLRICAGANFLIKAADKLFQGKLSRAWYTKNKAVVLYNLLSCEAHHEVLKTAFFDLSRL